VVDGGRDGPALPHQAEDTRAEALVVVHKVEVVAPSEG
jgi:hypothetical protein